MIEYLLQAYRLSFTLEVLAAELMYLSHAKRRPRFPLRLTVGVILYLMFSELIVSAFPQVLPEELPFAALCSTAIFLVSILLMCFCFDAPWQHTFFLCVSAFITQNLALDVGRILHIVFGLTNIGAFAADIFALILVYAVCYFLLARKHSRGYSIVQATDKFSLKLLISVTAFCAVVTLNTMFGHNGLDYNLYCRIALLCTCCFALAIQYYHLQNCQVVFEKQMIRHILLSEREHYQISKNNIDLINMKYHDIKHQIAALRTLHSDERDAAIRELENAAMLYDSVAKTGNETLDAILTDKMLLCQKHNILLTYIVDPQRLDVMQPLDLYCLFGNAIDNAIESVLKAPEDKRVISLRVSGQGNMSIIHLENYCCEVPVFRGGLPVTTKQDTDFHGFGVKSIQFLVEKYHGNLSIQVEHDIFALDILIPSGSGSHQA